MEHRCRLPTQDQLRARLQGLMDQHEVTRAVLAGWMQVSRPACRAALDAPGLSLEDARRIAALLVTRGKPVDPARWQVLLEQAGLRLLEPVMSRQMLRLLADVQSGYDLTIWSRRRVLGLVAEGLLTWDADDVQITPAGADMLARHATGRYWTMREAVVELQLSREVLRRLAPRAPGATRYLDNTWRFTRAALDWMAVEATKPAAVKPQPVRPPSPRATRMAARRERLLEVIRRDGPRLPFKELCALSGVYHNTARRALARMVLDGLLVVEHSGNHYAFYSTAPEPVDAAG